MHCALRLFNEISNRYSTDYYAVANTDLFPGIKSISPYSGLCLVFQVSWEVCKHLLRTMFLALCMHILHTHIYTHPCICNLINSLFVSSLLKMFRNVSVICGWLDLVSNLQKPIILLTTNRSFHRMPRGRENMHSTVKTAHTGAELFLPTSQNLTLSNCK